MNTNGLKLSLSAAVAAIGGAMGTVMLPFCVLCVLMCADYCTGLVKGWQKGTLSSRTGATGFLKKLCYCIEVVAAAGVDYIIAYCGGLLGKSIVYRPVFVLLVIVWLCLNECISILENLTEIGVPLPDFLMAIAKRLMNGVEKRATGEEFDENDEPTVQDGELGGEDDDDDE